MGTSVAGPWSWSSIIAKFYSESFSLTLGWQTSILLRQNCRTLQGTKGLTSLQEIVHILYLLHVTYSLSWSAVQERSRAPHTHRYQHLRNSLKISKRQQPTLKGQKPTLKDRLLTRKQLISKYHACNHAVSFQLFLATDGAAACGCRMKNRLLPSPTCLGYMQVPCIKCRGSFF